MKTAEEKKEEFEKEALNISGSELNAAGTAMTDDVLKKLGKVYGAADALSMKYAVIYRRALALLSAAATLITFAFLLYDEAELHWMIVICGVMIICLFAVNRTAGRLDCHRKYLEYRVLAEAARVQFYVRYAGTKIRVPDIMPWPLRLSVPWVKTYMEEIMDKTSACVAHDIRSCWIEDQKRYHVNALKRTNRDVRVNNRIVLVSLVISVCLYVFALAFEIRFAGLIGGNTVLDIERIEYTRTLLKIVLGTASAATLFTGNYFGRLSLDNAENDHSRMIELYSRAEELICQEGQNDALILRLAREELNENSSWYSYQSVNKPGISI